MKTVAVTGSSGYIGRKLLERLSADPAVARVIGIDVSEPRFSTRNLEFYRMDVRAPELREVIAGCDAVVHLAAADGRGDSDTYDVNVAGTRAVLAAVEQARPGQLVFASSHRVYGYHADNDYPLTEDSPLRPSPADAYGTSKAEAERAVSYFAQAHPEVAVAILRLAWVGGPGLGASPAIESPVRLAIRGYEPEVQAVHEDDAAACFLFVLHNRLRGVFNVAADDRVVRLDGVFGQRRVTLDLARARRLLESAGRLGGPGPRDLGPLLYPCVMSSERIRAAGFAFTRSTAQTMAQSAAARREWTALGPLRFRPRRAAAVAGTMGLVLVGELFRRRPRRRLHRSLRRGPRPERD
jgi:UDP-glucose 4-epimerase